MGVGSCEFEVMEEGEIKEEGLEGEERDVLELLDGEMVEK